MNPKPLTIAEIILLIVVIGAGGWWLAHSKNQDQGMLTTYISSVDWTGENRAISDYYLKLNRNAYYQDKGKLFCDAQVAWEDVLSPIEKVVYAHTACYVILEQDGDLYLEGAGGESPLHKLARINGGWQVVDRYSGHKQPTQGQWFDYEKKIPQNIRDGSGSILLSTKNAIIQQAARFYGLQLPQYAYNLCSSSRDCEQGEVCLKHGVHSNPGLNACVKKCSANRECGIAHACVAQCVNGENGCPGSSVPICIPYVPDPSLGKDPEGIIQ